MPYQFLEHTADLKLNVSGQTLEELFIDALKGMMEALKPKTALAKNERRRTISLSSPDATALLIDFLSQSLSLSQIHQEAYHKVNFRELSENKIKAELIGRPVQEFAEDIKAVTYHQADVQKTNNLWQVNIIFDI